MSASGQIPAALKAVAPFLIRAKELDAHDPIMAYFCRYHACQKGAKLRSGDPDENTFLMNVMDDLEKAKQKLGEKLPSGKTEGREYVEKFANRIFHKADDEDRAGNATLNTAKTFLAASLFFECGEQFGDSLSEEVMQTRKYALWKAVDIQRCIKSGIRPQPGAPGENDVAPNQNNSDNYAAPPSTAATTTEADPFAAPDAPVPIQPIVATAPFAPSGAPGHIPSPIPPAVSAPAAPAPATYQAAVVTQPHTYSVAPAAPDQDALVSPAAVTGAKPPPTDTQQALRYARFAVSALQFEDLPAAYENLQNALAIVGRHI